MIADRHRRRDRADDTIVHRGLGEAIAALRSVACRIPVCTPSNSSSIVPQGELQPGRLCGDFRPPPARSHRLLADACRASWFAFPSPRTTATLLWQERRCRRQLPALRQQAGRTHQQPGRYDPTRLQDRRSATASGQARRSVALDPRLRSCAGTTGPQELRGQLLRLRAHRHRRKSRRSQAASLRPNKVPPVSRDSTAARSERSDTPVS